MRVVRINTVARLEHELGGINDAERLTEINVLKNKLSGIFQRIFKNHETKSIKFTTQQVSNIKCAINMEISLSSFRRETIQDFMLSIMEIQDMTEVEIQL